MVVVVVVVVVWWRPHLDRHQWIVPEYIRTLDSTGVQDALSTAEIIFHKRMINIT
jgi:hypothetical protein